MSPRLVEDEDGAAKRWMRCLRRVAVGIRGGLVELSLTRCTILMTANDD
jgi:hypothetical protein